MNPNDAMGLKLKWPTLRMSARTGWGKALGSHSWAFSETSYCTSMTMVDNAVLTRLMQNVSSAG